MLIDKIVARVNGVNIMYSTLQVDSVMTGRRPTLDEAIADELWVQRAKARNLEPSDLDIDKQIISMKQQNNLMELSDEEVDQRLIVELGMNLERYRLMVKRASAASRAQSQELWGRCTVRAREVEDYCKKHPQVTTARYRFKLAPLTEVQTAKWNIGGTVPEDIEWDEFDWIEKPRLATHLRVVTSMKPGEISKPIKTASGYVAVQLIEKVAAREQSLQERYGEVEQLLRNEKMDVASIAMGKELFKDAIIVKL